MRPPAPERGFVLLLVLWTLALLALAASWLITRGGTEARLAENLRAAATVAAAADGAAAEAIFRLVGGQWVPGPVLHRLRLNGCTAMIAVADESGKVNPNMAPPELMAALLRNLGADPQVAAALARAIDAFHQPDGEEVARYRAAGLRYGPTQRPFQNLAELRQVLGMTPALYARLVPHLSLATPPVFNPAAANPMVAKSFQDAGPNGGYPPGYPPPALLQQLGAVLIARITVHASLGRARFSRVAIVELDGQPDPSARPLPYTILSWSGGAE